LDADLSLKETNQKLLEENQTLLDEVGKLKRELKKREREIRVSSSFLDKVTKASEAKDTLNNALFDANLRQRAYTDVLLQNCPNIIILFDDAGRFILSTDSLLAAINAPNFDYIKNLKYDEVFPQYFAGEDMDAFREAYNRAASSDETIHFNALVDFSRIGQPRFFSFELRHTGNKSKNREPAMSGVLAVMIDLTDVMREKQRAEDASSAKSRFLSNMSHEIRTPLNAIIGMTSIGKSAVDTTRKDYCFAKIEDASKHLLGVINDILDMSKIEAGKFELSLADFDFEKMLQKVVNVVTFRSDEKHQQFSIFIDKSIPKTLVGDDQRLMQVITNLLGNAIKFTPDGGSVSLNTKLLNEENGVCAIQFKVSDTGIGISQEQQARLFTSFQQAESSTTRKFGGTGLGLTISANIVEMMGGRVWIESELGKGATFGFTAHMQRGEEKAQDFSQGIINWKNIHILAVDDDRDILVYMQEIFLTMGIVCDAAESGEDALRLVERNGNYDIYFIDWKMPVMDGIELTRRLKARESAERKVFVIMISSYAWTMVEREAKSAGVDKFLSKPLFPSSIADIINECLGFDLKQLKEEQKNITANFSGRHILLAEDVEINREIVQALLEPTFIKIDCAENGKEALEMFTANPDKYDLIFMDMQMPEMDGYEATRLIRALDIANAKTIPIIAMTANAFKEDVEKCLSAGMNGHIGKPLNFEEVLNNLLTYFETAEN